MPVTRSRPVMFYILHWRGMLIALVLTMTLCFLGTLLLGWPVGLFVGAVVMVVYSKGIRRVIVPDYFQGIKHIKRNEHDAAIERFQRCLGFLSRHPWIDRWRNVVLLWPSPYSLTSSCFHCMGASHLRANRVDLAKENFKQALALQPNHFLSAAYLENIESIEAATLAKAETSAIAGS